MACLLQSGDHNIVAIVTVEQHSNSVADMDFIDVAHSISGRVQTKKESSPAATSAQAEKPSTTAQSESERVDTKAQGFSPIKTATISISDLLETVKQTHQSILSEDVLAHFGEERNPADYYTGRAQFSLKDTDSLVSDQMTDALLNDRSFVDYLTRADRINTIAQEPGVRVRFVDGVRGGRANAGI